MLEEELGLFHQEIQKKLKESISFLCFLDFLLETDNHEEELENLERMDAVKIPEEGHFYPIVDIQRFACNDGHHTSFLL